ncbi:hypothetical protein HHK36_032765 [Tetracentron sinense]|uniref:Maintenance of Photosystem II under High light 2 C-terminal domain-containing protein n=1 Tax=Tetracentron sinense TaxID=13715 RepID=A0A834Y783_TETSI|nr:hypothetical protein HHK36_032765 [Tetracentron sinense]
MATIYLSTANTFLPSLLSSSVSSSSLTTTAIYPQKKHGKRDLTLCKASSPPYPTLTKRSLAICFTLSLASKEFSQANAAILEADDDEELLEKVKRDRKKRLEKQEVINSSNKETVRNSGLMIMNPVTMPKYMVSSDNLIGWKWRIGFHVAFNEGKGYVFGNLVYEDPSLDSHVSLMIYAYLQELVYKLSKVGQAIDSSDFSSAILVLGPSTDADWVKKVNVAFTKLSSSPEEKSEVDMFNSSLASLISSVTRNDVKSSKTAFVSSASAFEKWTALTGLVGQLKGL